MAGPKTTATIGVGMAVCRKDRVQKVFEQIVHHQLYTCLNTNSIFSEVQLGLRPQHTTQDVLVGTIDASLEAGTAWMKTSWWVQSWWT